MQIFESVPNFSEGRRDDVIDELGAVAARYAHKLDVDADRDHNRVVVSLAGSRPRLTRALMELIGLAVERIDLRSHTGVHPRVGAADVVPIVPLGGSTALDDCREIAHELGERVWTELRVPVFFYGHGEERSLADIRAGRAQPSLGGPTLHPTAGAVCLGARRALLAFNVILYDTDIVAARAVARSIRESGSGLRGVQALAFPLSGDRVQLSMNLFRVDETTARDVIYELERRGISMGAHEVVGLCPAAAASDAASGRILEGRLAAAAASAGAAALRVTGDEEHDLLAARLDAEAVALAALEAGQDAMLAAAERSAALIRVLEAGGVRDEELTAMLRAAALGLVAALSDATRALYAVRTETLERDLTNRR